MKRLVAWFKKLYKLPLGNRVDKPEHRYINITKDGLWRLAVRRESGRKNE